MKKVTINIILFMAIIFLLKGGIMAEETKLNKATFAGGCFWCMETAFEKIDGMEKVVSGYTGGEGENPTYEDYGKKGHIEVK